MFMFILYHVFRKFLQKLPSMIDYYPSNIRSKLGDKFGMFKSLTEKDLDWSSERPALRIIEADMGLPMKHFKQIQSDVITPYMPHNFT